MHTYTFNDFNAIINIKFCYLVDSETWEEVSQAQFEPHQSFKTKS